MRLTLALTALGLASSPVAGHVAGQQQQWQDFGAMPDPMKQSFYDAVARPAALAKRDGECGEGRHPCSDLNSTLCCGNTDYCLINETSLAVQCCALGSSCGFSCGPESYYAVVTVTQTDPAGGGGRGSTTTSTAGACVGRLCPTSTNYLCPESMGGKCCAYGQNCASSGQCLDFGEATSTSSGGLGGPTVATMIPSGCSAQGDSTCSVGGPGIPTTTGCCGAGYTCAVDSESRAVCAPASSSSTASGPVPTGSGISVVSQDQGLSTAAKAGIAVGVVVASAIAIGAATWFCLRRRRRSARSTTTTGNELGSGVGGGGGGAPGGMMAGGGRHNHNHRLAAAGRYESDDGGIQAYGPSSGPHMSEADGYAASSSAGGGGGGGGGGGRGPLPGLGQDYFGPVAASGPYTTPPEYPNSRQYHGGAGDDPARPVRGDGATPHGPNDITSAVEIGDGGGSEDSLVRQQQQKKGGGDEEGSELDGGSDTMLAARRQGMRQGVGSPAVRDSIMGRFELYGTDVPVDTRAPRPLGTPGSELSASELGTPSPMSHEEQQQQAQSNKKTGPAG